MNSLNLTNPDFYLYKEEGIDKPSSDLSSNIFSEDNQNFFNDQLFLNLDLNNFPDLFDNEKTEELNSEESEKSSSINELPNSSGPFSISAKVYDIKTTDHLRKTQIHPKTSANSKTKGQLEKKIKKPRRKGKVEKQNRTIKQVSNESIPFIQSSNNRILPPAQSIINPIDVQHLINYQLSLIQLSTTMEKIFDNYRHFNPTTTLPPLEFIKFAHQPNLLSLMMIQAMNKVIAELGYRNTELVYAMIGKDTQIFNLKQKITSLEQKIINLKNQLNLLESTKKV